MNMTKVLICGKDSYIGKAFIAKMLNTFEIDELDLLMDSWENFDFPKDDVLLYLSAIVHRKNTVDDSIYLSVNRDLPILVNQWANVVRWEMRTRLFLRTT